MARINFNQIFNRNQETGAITPRSRVRVGGVTFGPGMTFVRGTSFNGIDLSNFINNDFEVDVRGDLFIVKGIYAENRQTCLPATHRQILPFRKKLKKLFFKNDPIRKKMIKIKKIYLFGNINLFKLRKI